MCVSHCVAASFIVAVTSSFNRRQASLKELLLRLALDHPYHSLYHLYALANGNRDALGRRMQGQVRATSIVRSYLCSPHHGFHEEQPASANCSVVVHVCLLRAAG
jgi:hypothetical protein